MIETGWMGKQVSGQFSELTVFRNKSSPVQGREAKSAGQGIGVP